MEQGQFNRLTPPAQLTQAVEVPSQPVKDQGARVGELFLRDRQGIGMILCAVAHVKRVPTRLPITRNFWIASECRIGHYTEAPPGPSIKSRIPSTFLRSSAGKAGALSII